MTILGGSGSGKTILLKALLRLLVIDSGKILFEGRDIIPMNEEDLLALRRRVGMLFQGAALFDSLSVAENSAYPLREHFKKSEEEISAIVKQKLALVGLPGIEEALPNDLSGGMKKRVALARAIATDPEVLLYDEPTTGLDPINTTRINNLIKSIQEKMKVTSIVVTHDMGSAFSISDRLAFLYKGKIETVGTKDQIQQSNNALIQSFITGEIPDERARRPF
ncbi:MAG: ATP-binding cassette domain-containing protein [Deltaproteobacteria bacterium]|nr:MAG: ATP-binding cassette domain-containing protein [Deltaproteobacteria bacterium]